MAERKKESCKPAGRTHKNPQEPTRTQDPQGHPQRSHKAKENNKPTRDPQAEEPGPTDPKSKEKPKVFQTFSTKVIEIRWFSNNLPQKIKNIQCFSLLFGSCLMIFNAPRCSRSWTPEPLMGSKVDRLCPDLGHKDDPRH